MLKKNKPKTKNENKTPRRTANQIVEAGEKAGTRREAGLSSATGETKCLTATYSRITVATGGQC